MILYQCSTVDGQESFFRSVSFFLLHLSFSFLRVALERSGPAFSQIDCLVGSLSLTRGFLMVVVVVVVVVEFLARVSMTTNAPSEKQEENQPKEECPFHPR